MKSKSFFLSKKKILKISLTPLIFFLFFLLFDLIFPFRTKINYSQLINARDSTVLYAFLSDDDKWRMKTDLHEIIPQLKNVIIFKEDKYFYYHPGVNPFALLQAFGKNLIRKRHISGASTISMQVARLLEPKSRTYGNKFIEIFRAFQLELHFSKDEILQLYLNLVPYGGNVEGVKSASVLYFNRLPNQLSLAQVVTLAIVPNRPTSLNLGKTNGFIFSERNKWIRRLPINDVFQKKDIEDALSEPLEVSRHEAPKFAQHFAYRMKKKFPSDDILYTSLDKEIQEKVQQLVFNYSKRIKLYYINNICVLVVENDTRKIIAYIGSQNFNDNINAGQVDGIKAIRSPGSTLKPLIYALGFDEGIITPKTILSDVPTIFGNFTPDNYDEKFRGKVSVEKALSLSLNIPAVNVLEQTGLPLILQKLKFAGFKQIQKDQNKLGLSLILGGCGVSLEQLTALYSSFANNGSYLPLQFTSKVSNEHSQILLVSPEAVYMTTKILTLANRPDLPNGYENTYHIPKIAWKTGTSFGRRDAWSIGYNKKYTVGVWIGNFSGNGVQELSGAEIATPLLFNIFNSIDYNSTNNWFQLPKNLKVRLVCSESGKIPNDFCKNNVVDYYLPTISSNDKCDHLKEVIVSVDGKISYCTSCQPEKNFVKRLYPNLRPEMIDFYEKENISYEKIPIHNPNCNRVFDKKPPLITAPSDKKFYIIDRKSPPQIELSCQADNEVKKIYWYINDKFYKNAGINEKVFFSPQAGKIKISCSDDKGLNTNIEINVQYE